MSTVSVDEVTFRRTFACKFVADHFPAATTPARTLGSHRFPTFPRGFPKDETCCSSTRPTPLQIGWQEFCHLGNCPPCGAEFSTTSIPLLSMADMLDDHVCSLWVSMGLVGAEL